MVSSALDPWHKWSRKKAFPRIVGSILSLKIRAIRTLHTKSGLFSFILFLRYNNSTKCSVVYKRLCFMSLFWVDRIKSGVVSIDIYVYDFFFCYRICFSGYIHQGLGSFLATAYKVLILHCSGFSVGKGKWPCYTVKGPRFRFHICSILNKKLEARDIHLYVCTVLCARSYTYFHQYGNISYLA